MRNPLQNLLTGNEVHHKALCERDAQHALTRRTTFTAQDVWNYLHLSYLGRQQPATYDTWEGAAAYQERLLQRVPPATDNDLQELEQQATVWGLDVVLFAIDELAADLQNTPPTPQSVRVYCSSAKGLVRRLQLAQEMARRQAQDREAQEQQQATDQPPSPNEP